MNKEKPTISGSINLESLLQLMTNNMENMLKSLAEIHKGEVGTFEYLDSIEDWKVYQPDVLKWAKENSYLELIKNYCTQLTSLNLMMMTRNYKNQKEFATMTIYELTARPDLKRLIERSYTSSKKLVSLLSQSN